MNYVDVKTYAYLLPSSDQYFVYAWKDQDNAKSMQILVEECRKTYPLLPLYESVHKIARERFIQMTVNSKNN